jgi:hypothetical protein
MTKTNIPTTFAALQAANHYSKNEYCQRDAFQIGWERKIAGGRAWAPDSYPTNSIWFEAFHEGFRAAEKFLNDQYKEECRIEKVRREERERADLARAAKAILDADLRDEDRPYWARSWEDAA